MSKRQSNLEISHGFQGVRKVRLASYAADMPPRCSQPGQRPCPEIVEHWQAAQAERVAKAKARPWPEHSYRIGQTVQGRNAAGLPFEGVVTAVGAHHVVIDEIWFTPLSLLVAGVAAETPAPSPPPKVAAVAQFDLFGGGSS